MSLTSSSLPESLPEELLLQIFRQSNPEDLLSIRHVSKRFRVLAEDVLQNQIIPHFTIGLNYTLGSGTHHRWYDIRARITLSFTSFCKHNPQYALFNKIAILPESCHERAWEKWNQIAAGGLGGDVDWRVQLGSDGELRTARMPKLVVASTGVWCDWIELTEAYVETSSEDRGVRWLSL